MNTDTDPSTEPKDASKETSPSERYAVAQEAFNAQLELDFPAFSIEEYAAEKAAAEGIDREGLGSRLWSGTKAIPDKLDRTGDGKLGLDDAQETAKQAGDRVGAAWGKISGINKQKVSDAASSAGSSMAGAARNITGFDYTGAAGRTARNTKQKLQEASADKFKTSRHTVAKIGKTATGVQGYQNRKEAAQIKEIANEYIAAAEALTEERRAQLGARIEEFGAQRLEALSETLGRFLVILEQLKQKNQEKEYELLDGLGIDTEVLEDMGALDMNVRQSLGATAATGALGVAAVMGTPALVTGTVGLLATASTGTAISGLTGAAYTNAVLAWLGGGSLAAGGGGMAAGTVVLAGITAGATAGVTILSAGILVSTHYGKKLTEAKTYQKEVALAVAGIETAWLAMDAITSRIDELAEVTEALRERIIPQLDELESLIPIFDGSNVEHAAVFNRCGKLVKTMVELAQVPLLGNEGELTDDSFNITVHVKKVLNTEV